MPRQALIAGLGLIGGSIGMALRRQGWNVVYLDPNVSEDDARRCGAADARVTAIEPAAITILATPVDAAIEILRNLPDTSGVVTSVCSVMQPLRDVANCTFVAGHPMAGSEERGIKAARADLLNDATWFVDAHHEAVADVGRDCSATLDVVDAREHDRAVALTSHLPQVLSTALAAYLQQHDDVLRFAGSGLRTFLRLAGSDASVWKPILDANRENVAAHAAAVAGLVREIIEGDSAEAFENAQRFWRKL